MLIILKNCVRDTALQGIYIKILGKFFRILGPTPTHMHQVSVEVKFGIC